MQRDIITWDIYEITSLESSLNGVMLRGKIRKLGIEKGFNVLVENTEDLENGVRFAVVKKDHGDLIARYLQTILVDVRVELRLQSIPNPVLSKLKVNDETRYTL